MQCDFCSNDANIEIVVFVNGQPKKMHLCSSCYQEKLEEMADHLPEEWGGKQLGEQIRSMLEKAQEAGGLIQGMEFSMHAPEEDLDASDLFQEADEEEEEKRPSFGFPPLENLSSSASASKKDRGGEKSARELAFAKQRKSLLGQRAKLLEKMQFAIQAEDYEACARYRDELDQIGDSLLRLNEERKDPYGV